MIWTLNHFRLTGSPTADCTIYAFSHEPANLDRQKVLLSDTQRVAICRFLRYFTEHDPEGEYSDVQQAAKALKRMGWGQYCLDSGG